MLVSPPRAYRRAERPVALSPGGHQSPGAPRPARPRGRTRGARGPRGRRPLLPGLARGEVALDHRPPRRGPRLQRVPLQGPPRRRWPGRGCGRLRRGDHYGAPGGHRRRCAEAMNRVCLIGLVGCWPRPVGPAGDLGFVLLTERDPLGQRVDRHRVILGGIHLPDISDFAPGATVYVEGHLARQGESRRVSVIAGCAWSILPAPPPPVAGEPTSSRASPRAPPRSRPPR